MNLNIKNFVPMQRKQIEQSYKVMELLGQGSFGCVKKLVHK